MTTSNQFGRSLARWAREADTETIAAADADGSGPDPAKSVGGARYTIEASIGRGGMGEVLLVEDRDLRREVAMKVIREERASSSPERLRFLAEAQATSQLEHPGIPPIHDIGVTPDGQMYFTMKLVRGRTLREVLKDLLLGSTAARREFNLHRLVSILDRVAEALHFAHVKGVVHRDLKPENVMLGEYGEVHVVDWGIAKVRGETEDEGATAVETAETDSGLMTMDGALKGTVRYMSPEQAAGRTREIDGRTDVYAMGCILYEMLTLRPPFEGRGPELLARVRDGEFVNVRERNARRPVPNSMADLCTRAMAKDKGVRPASARAFAEELHAWLDGRAERERRREEAEQLARKGEESAARYREIKAEVIEAAASAKKEAARYKPWQPVTEKRPAIAAAKRVEDLKTDVALAFADTTNTLTAALVAERDNTIARAALADLYKELLEEAEAAGDCPAVAHAEQLVRRYDDGRLAHFLAGDGTLQIESDPPGAAAMLYRYEDRDGVLTPADERRLGVTPFGPVALPMGSYLCVLKSKGCRTLRYPVHITRNREWRDKVQMRTDNEIGEGFVHVPAGPFLYAEGQARVERVLHDFAIGKHPVTYREYSEFLSAVEAEEGLEAAEKRVPVTGGDSPLMERIEERRYVPIANKIVEREAFAECVEAYGDEFAWNIAVSGVSWHDAVAYCEWRSKTDDREWRLPTEQESEKAARGVDGRRFPWGDLADATLGKCRDSRSWNTQPEPVGAYPISTSLYGMGDAAGGMWDWTSSAFAADETLRVLRGASFYNDAEELACANANRSEPHVRNPNFGFRCARSL